MWSHVISSRVKFLTFNGELRYFVLNSAFNTISSDCPTFWAKIWNFEKIQFFHQNNECGWNFWYTNLWRNGHFRPFRSILSVLVIFNTNSGDSPTFWTKIWKFEKIQFFHQNNARGWNFWYTNLWRNGHFRPFRSILSVLVIF